MSKLRGFAAMDKAVVSEIARKGGVAAHVAGTAHKFNSDEARIAGAKGGRTTHARKRARAAGLDAAGQVPAQDVPAGRVHEGEAE